MFVYVILMKIFGQNVFPVKYLLVIFFSSMLSILLLFMPPRFSKENFYPWFYFISLMLIFLPFASIFIINEFNLFILSNSIKNILGVMVGLGFIGVFGSFFFDNGREENKEGVKRDVINSFKKITERFNLKYEDSSTDSILYLEASGNYKGSLISLLVKYRFYRPAIFTIGSDTSTIMIETNREIPLYKIEVFKDAIKTENLSESQKTRVIGFIKEKRLDYYDFDINTYKNKILISINNQIEDEELWIDYIKLLDILLI